MQQQYERYVNLQGTYNFRDLGGYTTAEGKKIKRGLLYRSDELSRLTKEDLEILKSLNIKTIIDFRSHEETIFAPDKKPETTTHLNMPLVFEGITDLIKNIETVGIEFMMQLNRLAVEKAKPVYMELFKTISIPTNLPLVFHCAGGKDRTGLAAALFLSALDVEKETIYEDYLLSAELIRNRFILLNKNPNLPPGLTVKREYLKAAFDTIDNEYGGMKNYLVNKLEVDIELLKSIYTE